MFESLLLTSLMAFGTAAEVPPITNTNGVTETVAPEENGNSNLEKPILKKSQSISNNLFELEYEFNNNISSANIISNEVTLNNLEIDENLLTLQLQTNFEYSKFNLDVHLDDGTYVSKPVFAYKDTALDETFVSMESIDSAWYLAKKSGYEEKQIYDRNDIIEQYDQFASNDVIQEVEIIEDSAAAPSTRSTYTTNNGDTKVEGFLYWQDSDGTDHPLKFSRVDLFDADFGNEYLLQGIGTTFTDENGYYSFEFDNADGFFDFERGGYDPMIRIFLW